MRNYEERNLEFKVKFENNIEVYFTKARDNSNNYCANLTDEDGEFISEVELDESTFEKINEFHTEITFEIDRIKVMDSGNNLGDFPPVILEEQVEILEWAQALLEQGVSFFTIIENLFSESKSKDNNSSDVIRTFSKYNESWKSHILKSILLASYRLETDIKAGQVVTDGHYIGYAHNLDYSTRRFDLCTLNDPLSFTIGQRQFNIDDFRKY